MFPIQKARLSPLFSLFAAVALSSAVCALAGCGGTDSGSEDAPSGEVSGEDGGAVSADAGSDGGLSGDAGPQGEILERRTEEPAGINCALGGVRVESGMDTDGDGVLSEGEVTSTFFECRLTDAEFCARYGAVCGALSVLESSGKIRSVESCGVCEAPQSCSAETNTCGCTPKTCLGEGLSCGELYDGCGNFIRCGEDCASGAESVRLRLVTGNITSGGKQSYDDGPGIRIFQGLKPQIAFVQEFRFGSSSPTDIRRMVETAFGGSFFHVVQPMDQDIRIPNGIVSYYPIKEWGILDDATMRDRDHVWARIDIPGRADLWAVSVHIPTNGVSRQESISGLVEQLDALGIPEGDFVAIGGDFNTSSRTDDNGLRFLDDTGLVVLDTDADCPIDQAGNDNTNAERKKDFDAIYTSQNLKDLRTKVVIGEAQNLTARGLVFDSRVFTPLSAVPPVQKEDSGAEGMQHMAVVKDFAMSR